MPLLIKHWLYYDRSHIHSTYSRRSYTNQAIRITNQTNTCANQHQLSFIHIYISTIPHFLSNPCTSRVPISWNHSFYHSTNSIQIHMRFKHSLSYHQSQSHINSYAIHATFIMLSFISTTYKFKAHSCTNHNSTSRYYSF